MVAGVFVLSRVHIAWGTSCRVSGRDEYTLTSMSHSVIAS